MLLWGNVRIKKGYRLCGRCGKVVENPEMVDDGYYLCFWCVIKLRDAYQRKGADFWTGEPRKDDE